MRSVGRFFYFANEIRVSIVVYLLIYEVRETFVLTVVPKIIYWYWKIWYIFTFIEPWSINISINSIMMLITQLWGPDINELQFTKFLHLELTALCRKQAIHSLLNENRTHAHIWFEKVNGVLDIGKVVFWFIYTFARMPWNSILWWNLIDVVVVVCSLGR